MQRLRKHITSQLGLISLLCALGTLSGHSFAQQTPLEPPADEAPTQWNYTLGLRVRANDIHQGTQSVKLRPVIGIRYWRGL